MGSVQIGERLDEVAKHVHVHRVRRPGLGDRTRIAGRVRVGERKCDLVAYDVAGADEGAVGRPGIHGDEPCARHQPPVAHERRMSQGRLCLAHCRLGVSGPEECERRSDEQVCPFRFVPTG